MPARKKSRRTASEPARPKAAPKRSKPTKSKRAGARKPARRPAKPARRSAKPARRSARPSAPRPAARKSAPAPAPSPAAANAIGLVMQHLDYTTHDPDAVRRFYVEILGFSEANHDPSFNYLFVRTGATSSIGFMPPMPGTGPPNPVKEPVIYLLVEDVDRAYADLSMKGVHFEGPPADMPWGHRVVSTVDPEGRRVLLATATMPNA